MRFDLKLRNDTQFQLQELSLMDTESIESETKAEGEKTCLLK